MSGLTDGDLVWLRREHQSDDAENPGCRCGGDWPCDVARVLALLPDDGEVLLYDVDEGWQKRRLLERWPASWKRKWGVDEDAEILHVAPAEPS